MAEKYAVQLATDYLDRYFGQSKQATLVEMLEYADAHGKLVLTLDEVNEALKQRPSVYIERQGERIAFNSEGTERSISAEDHEKNWKAYHAEFQKRLKQLQTVRPARPDDASEVSEIYNHYIRESPATFEEVPLTAEEMGKRIVETMETYPWLVCEEDGRLLGYAYGHRWRERMAYRFTVEVSIYLRPTAVGKGRGSLLLGALLAKLRYREVHSIIGGVALPNEASVALLEKFGLRQVAHFKEVGYKFGRWIDVGYWQLLL